MTPEAGIALVALVATVGVAVVTWHRANRADRHADQALELARAAEHRADRLERRQLERRDVTWIKRDTERATVSFVNAGADTAYDVDLIVDSPNDDFPRRSQRHGRVEPAGRIGMRLHAEATARRETQELPVGIGHSPMAPLRVRVRITWMSELGAPEAAEFGNIVV